MRRDTWERDEDRSWSGRGRTDDRNGGAWNDDPGNWSRQDRGGYGAQENARGGYGTGGGSQFGPQPGTRYGDFGGGGSQYGAGQHGQSASQFGPQFGSPHYGGPQYGGSQWGSGFGVQPGASQSSYTPIGGNPYGGPYGSQSQWGGQPSYRSPSGGGPFGSSGPGWGSQYAPGQHEGQHVPTEHQGGGWQGYNAAPSMSSQLGMGGFTSSPFTPNTSFHLPHTAPSVPFNRPDWNEGRGHSDYRRGQWRGRTPKNYQRSDERIRDEIIDRLVHDSEIDASDVEITVVSGVVTLAGSVDDRRVKHQIEDMAEASLGVKDVTNNLRVSREDRSRSFENSVSTNAASAQSSNRSVAGSSSSSSDESRTNESEKSRSRQRV